jgi:RNA polymerase sigma-70 factor (ECF subfamily)
MTEEQVRDLLGQARAGNSQAFGQLFEHFRERLTRMLRLRLDRRLSGRLDPAAVLAEALPEAQRRLVEYSPEQLPFFLWLRQVTGEKLAEVQRRHLGPQTADAAMEVSLYRGALPQATSVSLAAQLLGKATSETEAVARAEHKLFVQEALNSMDALDREVLVLRHLEQLTNDETALVLNIKKSAASQHYIRALKRLKDILSCIPGLKGSV